ncbi:MAG: hypothetical protein PHR25_03385 [Clostridia bacterium]|nr:hypothetical protein [Clostridia bacterium]
MIDELIEYYKRENLDYKYFKKVKHYLWIYLIIYFIGTTLLELFKVDKNSINLISFICSVIYTLLIANFSINSILKNVNIKTYNNIITTLRNKRLLRKDILDYEFKIVKLKLRNMGITQKNQIRELVDYIRNTKPKESFFGICNGIILKFIFPTLLVFIPQIVLSKLDKSDSIVEYLTSNTIYLIFSVGIIYVPIIFVDLLIIFFNGNNNEKSLFKWLDLILTEIILRYKK